MVLPLIAAGAGAALPSLGRALSQPIYHPAPSSILGPKVDLNKYAMQDGIGRNPFGGPTTAPIHHNFNPSIADPRTRQQQMQDSQNFIGGLVGSVANLPGVRQTPIRFAGDLVSTLLNSGALNPYNHVRY
tara:strand:+ start:114 stop:503 length:390 start_codon:yes stop_codon:yes gene_type:complete